MKASIVMMMIDGIDFGVCVMGSRLLYQQHMMHYMKSEVVAIEFRGSHCLDNCLLRSNYALLMKEREQRTIHHRELALHSKNMVEVCWSWLAEF